jgi:polysaccharide export outer membrane protein
MFQNSSRLHSVMRMLYTASPMKTKTRWLFPISLLAATLLVWFSSGCETAVSSANLSSQAAPPARVTLAPGDTIRLSFPGATELNQTQKIRADGKLSLPMIGEVSASGKTLVGLQSELITLYKDQLKNSEVLVTLESAPATVVLSGAVGKPGRIAFDKPTTVFQAIMEAGGATAFGNLRNVRLVRMVNGIQHSQVLDVTPTLRGQATRPFYVRDGDVIYVPQSAF